MKYFYNKGIVMSYKEINAAVLVRKKSPLHLKKINFFGPVKKGQVLVKILYSGICGKQIDEIDGISEVDRYLPHCLGHEGSGLVLDVGAGVKKIKLICIKNSISCWETHQFCTSYFRFGITRKSQNFSIISKRGHTKRN